MAKETLKGVLDPVLNNLYIPENETTSFLDRIAKICNDANDSSDSRPKKKAVPLTPSQKQRNLDSFKTSEEYSPYINLLSNYNITDVPGDGDCFFHAISQSLFGTDDYHRDIRSTISEYIDNNFMVAGVDMSKIGTWGDHNALQAVANAYDVCILAFRVMGYHLYHNTEVEQLFVKPTSRGIDECGNAKAIISVVNYNDTHFMSAKKK